MKIKISKETLLKALMTLQKTIIRGNAQPILENVHYSAGKDGLVMTAYDGRNAIQVRIPADKDSLTVEKKGDAVLPPEPVINLLRASQDEEFTIEADAATASIAFKGGNAVIPNFDAADYPSVMPAEDPEATVNTIPADTFWNAVSATAYAAGDDELRPIMRSVFLDIQKDGMNVVCTDARRLVIYPVPDVKSETPLEFPMDTSVAKNIVWTVDSNSKDITLKLSGETLTVENGPYTFVTRPVAGKFPKWKSVVPKTFKSVMDADREALMGVVKRMLTCSDKGTSFVRFSVNPELLDATLTVTGEDGGRKSSGKETLPVTFEGEAVEIGFNGASLVEVLQRLGCKKVSFHLNGNRSAACIDAYEEEKDTCPTYAIVVPMFIK